MEEVNRIASVIGYFGRYCNLQMHVIITEPPKDQKRQMRNNSFYTETNFYSKSADQRMINIKLNFRYYMALEYNKPDERAYCTIYDDYMISIKNKLNQYYNLYSDKDTFVKDDNGKYILNREKAKAISIENLPFGFYLVFVPTVLEKDGSYYPATKLYVNSRHSYDVLTTLSLNKLVYIFNTFNMYQSALQLINFYGKPEFGTNRFIVEY